MDSPFAPRFNTNYIPTDEEIGRIRADLVSHTQELTRIDERMRELSAERDKIQAYIDSHKELISYPRRLPPDIVREIFVACLPSMYAVTSVREAPLVLCQICSAWRTIALSTPRLWSSLHLPIDFVLSKKEQRMPAVARWLELSGACPISFSLLGEGQDWGLTQPLPEDVTAFSKIVIESSNRWCNVEFSHVSETVVLALAGAETPLLESLKVTAPALFLRQLDLFQAPGLRAVAMHTLGPEQLDEIVLDMPLRWDRLTHLNLDSTGPGSPSQGLSLGNVFILLERCPQLVSFAFRANSLLNQADSISNLISLPFLKSFIVFEPGIVEASSIARLFEQLFTPELRQLHVPTISPPTPPLTNFLVNIGTMSPLLESLSITLESFSPTALTGGLKCLASLTKLTTLSTARYDPWGQPAYASHPENLFALLASSEPVLCPQLQELRVQSSNTLSKDVLTEFIHKRMDLTPQLRKLKIEMQRSGWSAPDLSFSEEEIQLFSTQGLDFSLIRDDPWGLMPVMTTQRTGLPTMNWF
ncbi:hypothetical protein MSAN_00084600 [Mycena sanguinolenta]|uniref:F-box domain-containing protein n=1 Tax=Mycena sanguinolenta TaxID=230812 RepID=A0A8H7DMJ5_9AGAR|nr:hypothetical protein MSAN_00084600 [Mycena sanguinolenta]